MKVEIINGKVTATADSLNDIEQLLSLASPRKKHKEHKKHKFTKVCPTCSREFKGQHALSLHELRAHRGMTWRKAERKTETV